MDYATFEVENSLFLATQNDLFFIMLSLSIYMGSSSAEPPTVLDGVVDFVQSQYIFGMSPADITARDSQRTTALCRTQFTEWCL